MFACTLAVLGIRALDQWVHKLCKDPIALLCHAFIYISIAAIGFQLIYLGIVSAFSPVISLINSTVDTLAEIPYPENLL